MIITAPAATFTIDLLRKYFEVENASFCMDFCKRSIAAGTLCVTQCLGSVNSAIILFIVHLTDPHLQEKDARIAVGRHHVGVHADEIVSGFGGLCAE